MSDAEFNAEENERAIRDVVATVRKSMTMQALIENRKLELAAWACAHDHRISCAVELVLQYVEEELLYGRSSR